MRAALWWLVALALVTAPFDANPQGHGHAHVHGVASLQIAVDGPTLTLSFRTPMENVVGFEHAPRTEQQKKALRDAEESLKSPASHFAPAAAARCEAISSRLESSFAATRGTGSKDIREKSEAGEAHAELTAQYVFRCQHPDRLQSVEVNLFDRFRNVRRVDVEFAGPRGQKAYRLTSKQRVAGW
jgi:uncharacterized protein DUF2796